MTEPVPTSANEFIEQQLRDRLRALEDCFDADAFTLVSQIFTSIDDLVRGHIERRKALEGSHSRLVVLLTTIGGSIEVVHRIVETIRHHYDHVTFVIPNYAYSAGTVLAMSGDEIYMDYYSRLGPIDPQVRNANGRWVPALGYLERYNQLMEKASAGNLNIAEAHLLINGFDQAELYQIEQARELSIAYLKDWLVNYKFRDWITTETKGKRVTPKMRERRAEEIAAALNETDRWHSHGHGISMELLRSELKLRINDLDDEPEKASRTKAYHQLLVDYMGVLRQEIALQTIVEYVGYRTPEA